MYPRNFEIEVISATLRILQARNGTYSFRVTSSNLHKSLLTGRRLLQPPLPFLSCAEISQHNPVAAL
jgi:hypothetical protein